MRPNNGTVLDHAHTMEVEHERDMSFNVEAIPLLMDNFIDMYSDADLAVIREYPSNAHDAHVEVGNTDPIRVYLPNPFNPVFRVVDNGPGMRLEDIDQCFGDYGYSTKRHTDEQSGMLGLGTKAALTKTDQFSVTSVKDGIKTEATVIRKPDGSGKVRVPKGGITETDEPNGTVIEIAIQNINQFNKVARRFYQFWEPGSILVDDEEPARPGGLQVTEDILVSREFERDYVIMGNLAYDVGTRLSQNLPWGYHVAAKITMGSVQFIPNREALRYTKLTEETLADITQRRKAAMYDAAQDVVNEAASRFGALAAQKEWQPFLAQRLTYRGEEIPDTFSLKDYTGWTYDTRAHKYAVKPLTSRLYAEALRSSLFVVNFTPEKVTNSHRSKIKQWKQENNSQARYVHIIDGVPDDPWLNETPQVDFATIKDIKLPRAPRSQGRVRPTQTFETWVNGAFESVSSVKGDDIIVLSSARNAFSPAKVSTVFPDAVVVDLARNRHDKFYRENRNARPLKDAVKDAFDVAKVTLTDPMKLVLSGQTNRYSSLKALDADRIDDPDVVNLIKTVKAMPSDHEVGRLNKLVQLMRKFYGWNSAELDLTIPYTDALDKYPLFDYYGIRDVEHVTEYLNHFYAVRTATKDN